MEIKTVKEEFVNEEVDVVEEKSQSLDVIVPPTEIETKEVVKNQLQILDDQFDIMSVINEYVPNVTKKMPSIIQGICLESEMLNLSDLDIIGNSDNGRIKAATLMYKKLTNASKAIFDNKLEKFLEFMTIYDADLFYAVHAESFGDEEFTFVCSGDNCEEKVEFKSKLSDLRKSTDAFKERFDKIKAGTPVEFFELTNNIIKINDKISFKLGLCSLSKIAKLRSMEELPDIIFRTLVTLDSIIFTEANKELPYKDSYVLDFVKVLEKLILPSDYYSKAKEIFKDVDVSYEVKVLCPNCGHVNKRQKNDILGDLVKKALA